MTDYTTEENQELIDTLKGPRYYRLHLWGYGGESAYINIDEKTYNFWSDHLEEHGDSDLVTYMVSAEDGDFEFDELEEVPADANFMFDDDGDARPWYEHHNEFCHQYGVAYDSARLSIDEIESTEYTAAIKREVVNGEELSSYIDSIMELEDYNIDLVEYDDPVVVDPGEGDYTLQFYSSEKGTFFDGIIETVGNFDPKKLKIINAEFPNGEDVVIQVLYDGIDIENQGGDTNGKGYSVHVWKNH